jgi:hypothetical protein
MPLFVFDIHLETLRLHCSVYVQEQTRTRAAKSQAGQTFCASTGGQGQGAETGLSRARVSLFTFIILLFICIACKRLIGQPIQSTL